MALLMDMITAGLESSQNVAEFSIAESLNHPHIIQRAQQELDAVVGRKRLVREEDLVKLPYVQGIVKETLRMHPPGPLGIPHANPKPVSIAGYTVPANCKVLVNMWAIGRDPACWDRAEEFLPERFINSDYDVAGNHFHFIPFSAGRRICVGYPLAMRSIPLVVATLLHSFEWKRQDGNSLETAKGLLSIKLASKINLSGHPRLDESAYY
ncbi:flavonoid 3',5'-hydroxylase [Selaginella moellendorffii]|nr:flavonoid 3',5'-hydroxylase [Selaginella moellendorffii]|eukprot:XP_002986559.2 flavonoid 3',5'-hydroxylase [Selaginella moellendorffii]